MADRKTVLRPPNADSLERLLQTSRAVEHLLDVIAPNWTDDENLTDTPQRVARFYTDWLNADTGNTDTTFEAFTADQMVIASGMRTWSLCAHHLLPFWCDVSIGYLANGRVLGLSKLARIAHRHAQQLTLQEKLVTDIAGDLATTLQHDNVAVIARGEHLCMTMRGIRTPALITSSAMRGAFGTKPDTRDEFLRLAT